VSERQERADLIQALTGYQAQAIAAMSATLGIDRARYPRKQHQVEALADRLAGGEGLAEQVAALEPAQREALAYVARKSGLAQVRSVTTLLRGQVEPDERADDLLLDLLKRGLLLFVAGVGSWKLDFSSHDPTFQARLLWVPRAVAAAVAQPGGWAALVTPASAPTGAQAGDAGPLLRDLFLVMRSVRARTLRITQQGTPHQSDLRRLVTDLRPHLDVKQWRAAADDILFALELAIAVGVVGFDEAETELVATAAAEEFTRLPQPAQVRLLLTAWQGLTWSELSRVPTLSIDAYYAAYGGYYNYSDVPGPEGLAAARQVIVEALTELADGAWWSVDSLSAALRRRAPDFLIGGVTAPVGGGFYYSSYGWGWPNQPEVDHYRGIRRAGVEPPAAILRRDRDWDLVEGAYLRQVLAEPLRWLGVVDAGLDAAGAVVALRVTPLGRSALAGKPAPSVARAGGPRLVVQPNFEVIVLDVSGSLDLMTRLDGFAVPRTADRAAVYQLTREGLVQALQGGARLEEIVRLLEEESGTPLPQNVRYSLEEWARHFERIVVRRQAVVLEADEPVWIDAWRRDPKIGPLLGERLGPTAILVRAEATEPLAALIARQRHLASEDAAGPGPGGWAVRDGGQIVVRSEALGRFERHRLEGFTEAVEETRKATVYRVTAASAARARAAGWTAAAVLGLLTRRLGSAPPAELALLIRGWLGELGPAQQAAVRLVRLPDGALWRVLEPLARDGGGLVARVAPALVVADEAGLARLGETLAAHGVHVEASLPERVAAPLLVAGAVAAPDELEGLQRLRGKPLRDFLKAAIADSRRITMLHQAANQKAPKRHLVRPVYVEQRATGYHLVAETETGATRGFKLDDIFGVALEEGR
jgi:hypothetical protein